MSANRSNPNGDFPVLGRIAGHFFTHFKNVPYQAWGVLSIPLSRHLPVVVQKILPERQLLLLTEPLIRKINDRSSHVIQHGGGKRMLSALSPMEQDGQYLFVGVNPCLGQRLAERLGKIHFCDGHGRKRPQDVSAG